MDGAPHSRGRWCFCSGLLSVHSISVGTDTSLHYVIGCNSKPLSIRAASFEGDAHPERGSAPARSHSAVARRVLPGPLCGVFGPPSLGNSAFLAAGNATFLLFNSALCLLTKVAGVLLFRKCSLLSRLTRTEALNDTVCFTF